MRTVTKSYQVAKFNELTKEQQTKVLDKLRDLNTDHDWYEGTLNEIKLDLETLGFKNIAINFTGFASQGDGASFTGDFDIPNKREMNKRINAFKGRCGIEKFVKLAEELAGHAFTSDDKEQGVSVYRISSHYYHENTVKSDCEFVDEWVKEYSRAIYRALDKENDYLRSDEAVKETIEANNYEFSVETLKIESAA